MRPDLSHIRHWIFDLDDTLYPREQGVMKLVEARINAFMIDATGLEPESARTLQKQFLEAHGTTLAGLMANYAIDPEAFLREVHDVPLDALEPNPALADAIARLPGRKLVFTNGARSHAQRVMARVGLEGVFDGVFAIEDADLVPKPEPATFRRLIQRFGVEPRRAVFFEDTPQNLMPAASLGMTTVLIGERDPGELAPLIHHRAPRLLDFLLTLDLREAA